MRISDWSSDVCSSDLELWRHEVQGGLVRRGVTYWPGDGTLQPRIFFGTGNGMTALSAATGEPDTAFGQAGSITFEGTARTSVVSGKSVSVRVDLGGRRIIKKKITKKSDKKRTA